ncbi:MAG: cupin domain-containing protein [Mesorhizobium sp.]|nr:cupin domain-containing protein [Mesorhizobium sp.]
MTIQDKSAPAAQLLRFLDTLVTVRLSANAGADRLSIVEHRMPYGESPPLHIHRNEDEVFHLLEGTMRFRVDGKDTIAHAGQIVLAPKGVPHSFRVESINGARCLTITTGGDFERMVREMAKPAATADLTPRSEPDSHTVQLLTMACARNGIDIVGPPMS